LGTYWSGVLAPAGTPASIVNKLNAVINEIMKSYEVQAGLATFGGEAVRLLATAVPSIKPWNQPRCVREIGVTQIKQRPRRSLQAAP